MLNIFYECNNLLSVSIGNGVTSVGHSAFYYCTKLKSVSIGNSVKTIGSLAFAGCRSLADFTCASITPPETVFSYNQVNNTYLSMTFDRSDIANATLHVPESALNIYGFSDPWKNFRNIVAMDDEPETQTYTLTYILDGEVFKTVNYNQGEEISPEPAPTKEGYMFSGWEGLPKTMPDHDVTVTGSFGLIGKYKLIYMVDGEVYRFYEIKAGSTITPIDEPTKEGYTFSGWSEIPEEMPAHDVTVTGTFTFIPLGKCAAPTVSLVDGKLRFECETENVEYHYEIVSLDDKSGNGNDIELTNTYKVTVYSSKEKYENSEIVTKEVKAGNVNYDHNGDNKLNVADIMSIINLMLAGQQ